MVITTFYAQKAIGIYNKQSSIRSHAYTEKGKDLFPQDRVTISMEAKRLFTAARTPREAVNSLTKQ
jgi:hypothetical protein